MRSKRVATDPGNENRHLVAAISGWVGALGFVVTYAAFQLVAEEGFSVGRATSRIPFVSGLASSRFWAAMRWPLLLATVPIVAAFLIFFRRPPSKSNDDSVSLDT